MHSERLGRHMPHNILQIVSCTYKLFSGWHTLTIWRICMWNPVINELAKMASLDKWCVDTSSLVRAYRAYSKKISTKERSITGPHLVPEAWWRHQMEILSALLTLRAGNSPVAGEFPAQMPRSFDVFFDLRLNKRLSKQSWGWWFGTPPHSLCSHCNEILGIAQVALNN